MNTNAIADWVRQWFAETSGAPVPDSHWTKSYFEAGIIDSLGIISLVEAIETRFEVRLPPDTFQDRRFSTMAGLTEIISELTRGDK
jgi:D-alanine--poly(phosphoribitol) ligase subunit 2